MLTYLGWYSFVILILGQLTNIGSNKTKPEAKVVSLILTVPIVLYIILTLF
jgi:hypothetical protein